MQLFLVTFLMKGGHLMDGSEYGIISLVPIAILIVGVIITKKMTEMLIVSTFIGAILIFKKGFFGFLSRNFVVGADRHKAASGRSRFVSFNSHFLPPKYQDNESKKAMDLLSALSFTIAFL